MRPESTREGNPPRRGRRSTCGAIGKPNSDRGGRAFRATQKSGVGHPRSDSRRYRRYRGSSAKRQEWPMVWHAGMGTDASDRPAALVTGANRGLGLETSVQLRAKGFRVVLTSRDEKKGTAAVRGFDPDGGDVLYHQLGITDRASISPVAKDFPGLLCRLDLLVNNAGI